MDDTHKHPTAEEIRAALDTLAAVKDWSEVVDDDLDGPDGRLEAIRSLAEALSGLAYEVSENIQAVADSELKEAERGEGEHAGFMFVSAYCSGVQVCQALAFVEAVNNANARFDALEAEHTAACQLDAMTLEEYEEASAKL